MAEQIRRVARPSSNQETPAVHASRGVSRQSLTLIIGVVALISGLATAGVGYYKFSMADKLLALDQAEKARTETMTLSKEASVTKILNEFQANPESHPRLIAELKKLHEDLSYSPPYGALSLYEDLAFASIARDFAHPGIERKNLVAERQKFVAEESAARAAAGKSTQETRKAKVDGDMADGVVHPAIPMLHDAMMGTVTGNRNLLGVPGGNLIGPQIPGPSSARQSGLPNPLADGASGLRNPYADDATAVPNPLKTTPTRVK